MRGLVSPYIERKGGAVPCTVEDLVMTLVDGGRDRLEREWSLLFMAVVRVKRPR